MNIRSFPIGLFIFVLFGVNLTGCGVQPASPTSTASAAQATATSEIPTQTPSPTSTPPESPLPPEMEKLQKSLNDNYEVTKEGIIDKPTGELLSDVKFDLSDPQKPTWSRKYQYMDFTGEDIKDNEGNPVQLDGIVVLPQPMEKITVDETGNPIFDFPGYTWNVDKKEFEREVFEGEPVLNTIEVQYEIIKNGDNNKQDFLMKDFKRFDQYGNVGIVYRGLKEPSYGQFFQANEIPLLVNSQYVIVPTTRFLFSSFINASYSYVVYKDLDDWKLMVFDVKTKWDDASKLYLWSQYYGK